MCLFLFQMAEDDAYWQESQTTQEAKAFNFEDDEVSIIYVIHQSINLKHNTINIYLILIIRT